MADENGTSAFPGDGPQESEADLAAVFDALPAMAAYWSPDMRNLLANRRYVEYFGLTPRDMLGKHASEIFGPELFALNRPYFEAAAAGEPQVFEREFRDPDGRERLAQASFMPHVVDGKVAGVIALVADITPRAEAERALAAAQARFRLAFAASPIGMGLLDGEGRLTEINPALAAMAGRSAEELDGWHLADLAVEEERPAERKRIGRLFDREEGSASAELQLQRADGSTIEAIVSVAIAHGERGEPLGIAQVQDITRLRASEQELRASRKQLQEAERIADIGSWEWDVASDRTSWSPGLFRIYGLSPEEFDPTLGGGQRRVYPPDRAMVAETLERALEERSGFSIEYRALRADGRVRLLRNRAEVVVDDEGQPVRVVGVARDVTESALTHEALVDVSDDLERRARQLREQASGAGGELPGATVPLTARQREIVGLIAEGLTNEAIAERLVVAPATVKWHVKQILAKTGAANRAEVVAKMLASEA